jgi:K+-transporting ATPase KdpF subunit
MPVSAGGRLSYQRKSISHDARNLAARPVSPGPCIDGTMPSVHGGLRKNLIQVLTMIFLTAVVSLLLFIYLFVALIRPEWF